MKKGERTYDPKHAWTTALLVLAVSLFFGLVVMPYVKPPKSKLVGTVAPDFALPVFFNGEPGNRVRLSEQKGKAVVLDFWASWCAPCRAQAPILDRVARAKDRGKVLVLGVNVDEDQSKALAFAKQAALSYTCVHDSGGHAGSAFGVRELPTVVVLDRAGRISAVRTRVLDQEELEILVENALLAPVDESS